MATVMAQKLLPALKNSGSRKLEQIFVQVVRQRKEQQMQRRTQ